MNLAAAAATPIAQWLNTFFQGYDYAILDFLNTLAINAGGILTPITKLISLLGEKGIIFYLLSLILLLFPKTRKVGVCVFGAVCCGALITNIILKDMVARPRPFEASSVFRSFWDTVGSPAEKGYSFPSGHVTAAAAGMFALWFSKGKKFALPTILWVGLMMFSRNYLMVHYPSDVLAALIIGIFSAFVAWLITRIIFNCLEDNDDYPFCNFILTFSLPFTAPSADDIKGKASDSFKSLKKKASKVSMPDVKGMVSNVSLPDVKGMVSKVRPTGEKRSQEAAVRKVSAANESAPVKENDDWSSRWDNYKKKKPSPDKIEDDDVKVFTGSAKAASISETESAAEVKPKDIPKVVEDKPARTAPKAPAAKKDDFDDLADIKALLESDTFIDEEPTPAPRRRSSYGSDGEYRGRH